MRNGLVEVGVYELFEKLVSMSTVPKGMGKKLGEIKTIQSTVKIRKYT